MDLAQSILKELVTLQKKNEELARIITKLEYESDVIIQQFENKVEELQRNLKHEQDDKSRSARRYEEEIRNLQASNDALIHEIADVRETFIAQINQLEQTTQDLTGKLELREQEYSYLWAEKEQLSTTYLQDIGALQESFAELQTSTKQEMEYLSSQNQVISSTLEKNRIEYIEILEKKDVEIHQLHATLNSTHRLLQDSQVREKQLKEQSAGTIDQLTRLIQTERQIRSRELKERDERISSLEESQVLADKRITRYEIRLHEEREQFEKELSRLNGILSESLLTQTSLNNTISELTSTIDAKTRESASILQKKDELHAFETVDLQKNIEELTKQILSLKATHLEEIQSLNLERESLINQVHELDLSLKSELSALRQEIQDSSQKISFIESENAQLTHQISEEQKEKTLLITALESKTDSNEKEQQALLDEIDLISRRVEEERQSHNQELSALQANFNDVLIERDQLESEKQERETYYREEITRLHHELSDIQSSIRGREERLVKEITGKDSQLASLSVNNELLRGEVERIRNQLGKLHETIRAEKDESVNALYREITSLESKLTEKNGELASLSDRIFRLDAENTRLLQAISEKNCQNVQINGKTDAPAASTDPKRREVFTLIADLEDPSRAAAAAEKLTALGSDIVNLLIPLLHTGSIQRRVWIAVVLYELNDNRATLPLMKLLETPKVHFRELIWEAKNQFQTRRRAGIGSAEPMGLQAGNNNLYRS
jgi:DNA repair exonuclease SbcCD ATPase subunit